MALFGRGRTRATFGLDIGSAAIKVVELSGNGDGYSLTAFATTPLARGAIAEGMIRDSDAVSGAIRECVRAAGISSTAAVIGVSGRETITKRVPLPRVSAKDLADAIHLEAEHHIPFAVDDVFLDYQVVGGAGDTMDVMLVAVKRVKVLEYVAAVEEAGLDAVVVDLDAFAIQNQFELAAQDGGEAVALIDIGASVMKTNVVRAGAPIFARDVPFGGNQYTEAIASRLHLPFDKAEAAKQGQAAGVAWEDVVPALEAVSRELSLEVQRTFDYFASTTAESERIGKIVLSGGCARMAGLDEFLSSSWGIPVEIARPLAGVAVPEGHFSAQEIAEAGPALAVAVGLALRRPGDKPA
jgi:type IV pilus assembly protein PilM